MKPRELQNIDEELKKLKQSELIQEKNKFNAKDFIKGMFSTVQQNISQKSNEII